MENVTRISDLPDNMGATMPPPTQTNSLSEGTDTHYTPINIHPNPYGISDQNPIMPNPEFTPPSVNNKPSINNNNGNQQGYDIPPPQQLPSRDIPSDPSVLSMDPHITPNYIPPTQKEDFLEDFETYEKGFVKEEKEEQKKDLFDIIMSHIQIPALLSVMFYLFNTAIFKHLLLFYIPYKYIYDSDGNLGKTGYIILSVAFGISYYLVDLSINYIGSM
jgi:hypothetical protein